VSDQDDYYERLIAAIKDALTTLEGTTGVAVDAARAILQGALIDGSES
jgi:hypothetical protein